MKVRCNPGVPVKPVLPRGCHTHAGNLLQCGLLGLQGRAFMGQEVAELEDRVVDVVAEHRFAEMLALNILRNR